MQKQRGAVEIVLVVLLVIAIGAAGWFWVSRSEGKTCGGIAGLTCPSGFYCQLDGDYPDAGGVCRAFFHPPKAIPTPPPVAVCPQDLKQCPNGTYVSRNPTDNCTFHPCLNDPTADWETYTDNADFSLKYPSDWTLKTSNKNLVSIQSQDISPEFEEPTSGAEFYLEIHPQADATNIEELRNFTQSTDTLEVSSKIETSFLGKLAIKYDADDATRASIKGVNIGYEKGFLRILLKNYSQELSHKETLNQILSTFEFVD